jgi:hypothetical protein
MDQVEINEDATESEDSGPVANGVGAMLRVRAALTFSARNLPKGLAINHQTGVISGAIDRHANRNAGAPFAFSVHLFNGNNAAGSINIALQLKNDPPKAVNDILDLSKKFSPLNVLANDHDADSDSLVITGASAQFGAVVFTSDGMMYYAPNLDGPKSGKIEADIIVYSIHDGHGGQSTASVIVLNK